MIKAVIFDLDGTLVLQKLRIREAKKILLERLLEEGVDVGWADVRIPTEVIVGSIHNRPRPFLMRLVEEVFTPYEVEAAEKAELRDSVRETLETLKKRGYMLAVASNNGKVGVMETLRRTGITQYFDTIVTRSDAQAMKPNGRLILKTLEALKIRGEEAVYVGDTAYDVMAAKAAGTRSIAVLGGSHGEEMLRNADPDLIITTLRELPEALNLLNPEN